MFGALRVLLGLQPPELPTAGHALPGQPHPRMTAPLQGGPTVRTITWNSNKNYYSWYSLIRFCQVLCWVLYTIILMFPDKPDEENTIVSTNLSLSHNLKFISISNMLRMSSLQLPILSYLVEISGSLLMLTLAEQKTNRSILDVFTVM